MATPFPASEANSPGIVNQNCGQNCGQKMRALATRQIDGHDPTDLLQRASLISGAGDS
jgi:hypothetical protein